MSRPTDMQRRERNAAISHALKKRAEKTRCPKCGRGAAMKRVEDSSPVIRVCRWRDCGYSPDRPPAYAPRVAIIHELKTWPSQYVAVTGYADEPAGVMIPERRHPKKHEVRRADRDYRVGDILHLREWNPDTQTYTGRQAWFDVTHITAPGTFGLPPDLCVMSICDSWPERVHRILATTGDHPKLCWCGQPSNTRTHQDLSEANAAHHRFESED